VKPVRGCTRETRTAVLRFSLRWLVFLPIVFTAPVVWRFHWE
jgi:hypothetical protein